MSLPADSPLPGPYGDLDHFRNFTTTTPAAHLTAYSISNYPRLTGCEGGTSRDEQVAEEELESSSQPCGPTRSLPWATYENLHLNSLLSLSLFKLNIVVIYRPLGPFRDFCDLLRSFCTLAHSITLLTLSDHYFVTFSLPLKSSTFLSSTLYTIQYITLQSHHMDSLTTVMQTTPNCTPLSPIFRHPCRNGHLGMSGRQLCSDNCAPPQAQPS